VRVRTMAINGCGHWVPLVPLVPLIDFFSRKIQIISKIQIIIYTILR